jgi:hypothetical protein
VEFTCQNTVFPSINRQYKRLRTCFMKDLPDHPSLRIQNSFSSHFLQQIVCVWRVWQLVSDSNRLWAVKGTLLRREKRH